MAADNNSTMPTDHEVSDSRGPVVTAVTTWMLVFSFVFVGLRCVSRLVIVKRWSYDDSFIILAWILAFGFSFTIFWGVRNGLGLHQEFIKPESELPFRISTYAFSVIYNPVLMATKTSILLFYLTLSKTHPVFKWSTLATLGVVNVAGLGLTLLNILQCKPVWAVFQQPIPSFATCTDIVSIYLASSPVNIATDVFMLFLPMPILTSMRLPRKQKIILVITFSFGAFVAAVDVVRISYLQSAFLVRSEELGTDAASSRILQEDDFSYYASLSFMWSAVEVHVGIICACVPSLKPLVAKILPSMLRDTNNPSDVSNWTPRSPSNEQHFNPVDYNSAGTPATGLPQEPSRAYGPDERGDTGSEHAPEDSNPNGSAHGKPDREVDFMEFLTTPDTPRSATRTTTAGTARTKIHSPLSPRSRKGSAAFFDFYNMKEKKPMTKLSNREALGPLALVTILFFTWGFAYGLLDVLNSQFRDVARWNHLQVNLLHLAYFAGYLIGPLTAGNYVFKKYGYRSCFITGLGIYGVGTLVFWPSAVLTSYSAFIISNLIVGTGVAVLEAAANPFIALCGPPRHAETRLNVSQGVQALGTVVAPPLAKKVLFKDATNPAALIDVQWTYLGIALFTVVLSVIFVYMPVPEGSDGDYEEVADKKHSINSALVFGKVKVVYVTLALGIFSNFMYVGAQESASVFYQEFVAAVKPDTIENNAIVDPFNYQSIGHTVFAVGRFVCAALHFIIKPRTILLGLFIGMIVTSALCMSLTGSAGVAMLVLYQLFQSGVFPLVFAISLRGLGNHTKTGAVLLAAATVGGAIFPLAMDQVAFQFNVSYSFCVVLATSAAGAIYPIYLATYSPAKKQVEPEPKRRKPLLPTERPKSHLEKAKGLFRRKKEEGVTAHLEEREKAT